MEKIFNQTYSAERSLYLLKNCEVDTCFFKDSEIAESPLKEVDNLVVKNCLFALRYPLWHASNSTIKNCEFLDTSRAALWYDKNLEISSSKLNGIKALRECTNIKIFDCTALSKEFAWKVNGLQVSNFTLESEYPFLMCDNVKISNITMKGKYSFQYDKNVEIRDSKLDTKDAFWHAENVLIENCEIVGEYIGWYSKNLTFKNCIIKGTQPFCYCENLVLENCELVDADLAFEYSSVSANLKGKLISVKNPLSGEIKVDEIDEIIESNSKYKNNCKIITNK